MGLVIVVHTLLVCSSQVQVEPNHILCGEAVSLWRGSELGETVESLADDDGHERHREVRIGGNKSVR